MIHLARIAAFLAVLALSGALAPAAAGPDRSDRAAEAARALERSRELVDLLDRVAERYRRFVAFRVPFEQSFVSEAFGSDEHETGTIHVQRPRRLLWLYDVPEGRKGVFDGTSWWLFDPEERQVTRHDTGGDDLLIDLLTGQLDPGQAFAIEAVDDGAPSRDGLMRIRLIPRQPRDDIDAVIVSVDPATLDLREIVVLDPLGSRWVYAFGPAERATPLADRAFHVAIPEGWSVARM